jgi:hypothetical protein
MHSPGTWSGDQRYNRNRWTAAIDEKSVRRRLAETEESDAQEGILKREG